MRVQNIVEKLKCWSCPLFSAKTHISFFFAIGFIHMENQTLCKFLPTMMVCLKMSQISPAQVLSSIKLSQIFQKSFFTKHLEFLPESI